MQLLEPTWSASPTPAFAVSCMAFDDTSSTRDTLIVGVAGGHSAYVIDARDGTVLRTLPLQAPGTKTAATAESAASAQDEVPVLSFTAPPQQQGIDDGAATAMVVVPRHNAVVIACGATGHHAVIDLAGDADFISSFGMIPESSARWGSSTRADAAVVALAVDDKERLLVSATKTAITVWSYAVWPAWSTVASVVASNLAPGASITRAFFATPSTIAATTSNGELRFWQLTNTPSGEKALAPVEVTPPPVKVAHVHRIAPLNHCERILAASSHGDWVVGWVTKPSAANPKSTVKWQALDASQNVAPTVVDERAVAAPLSPSVVGLFCFGATPSLTFVDTSKPSTTTQRLTLPATSLIVASSSRRLVVTAHGQTIMASPFVLPSSTEGGDSATTAVEAAAAEPDNATQQDIAASPTPRVPRAMIDQEHDVAVRSVTWSQSEFGTFSIEYSYINSQPTSVHRSVIVRFREAELVPDVRSGSPAAAATSPREHDYCCVPMRPSSAAEWALLGRELASASFCLGAVPHPTQPGQWEWLTAWSCASRCIDAAQSTDARAIAAAMCVQAAVLEHLGDRATTSSRAWCHVHVEGQTAMSHLQRLRAAVAVDPTCAEGWLALASWRSAPSKSICGARVRLPCHVDDETAGRAAIDNINVDTEGDEGDVPLDRLGCAVKAVELLPNTPQVWAVLCECFALQPGLTLGLHIPQLSEKELLIDEAQALAHFLSLNGDEGTAWLRLAQIPWPARFRQLGPRTLSGAPLMYGGGDRGDLPVMVVADCMWRAAELGVVTPSCLPTSFW